MKTIVTMALNPSIDKSSSVAHVIAEQKLYCKPPRFEPGGGGVNVSRAIKKLGGESMLFYPAGGLAGERLKELLDQEGLDHRPFPIEGVIRVSMMGGQNGMMSQIDTSAMPMTNRMSMIERKLVMMQETLNSMMMQQEMMMK